VGDGDRWVDAAVGWRRPNKGEADPAQRESTPGVILPVRPFSVREPRWQGVTRRS
jgi:hypothetical protein